MRLTIEERSKIIHRAWEHDESLQALDDIQYLNTYGQWEGDIPDWCRKLASAMDGSIASAISTGTSKAAFGLAEYLIGSTPNSSLKYPNITQRIK